MEKESNNMSPFHFLSFAATAAECFTGTARQMNRRVFVARTNLRWHMRSHVWPLEVELREEFNGPVCHVCFSILDSRESVLHNHCYVCNVPGSSFLLFFERLHMLERCTKEKVLRQVPAHVWLCC